MPILTQGNVQAILCELKKRIEGSFGVVNAMRQDSTNFEQWVQIEMCGILNGYIDNIDNIVIERDGNFDIRICGNNDDVTKVVIEIKIIQSGNANMPGVIADVDNLNAFVPDNPALERAFLAVVYRRQHNENDSEFYINQISVYIRSNLLENQSQVIEQEGFCLVDNNGENIEVVLYLNRWGGAR